MSIRDKLISGPLGFGAAPLGNMFRNIPEAEAAATVDAAWQQGIRYFDTAPLYGAGLSEMRLGRALAKHKRDEYVLSSKVGRLILDEVESGPRHLGEKGNLFEFGRPNRMVYDYSADGTLRSIEGSLKRLGVDRLDFVWIHDLSCDFHGDEWLARFETARTGAFRALTQLRERGVIKVWGLGVNTVEPDDGGRLFVHGRGTRRTRRFQPIYRFRCPPAPPRNSAGRDAGKARYRIVPDTDF